MRKAKAFDLKNVSCYVCKSKSGIRRVTFPLHKKLCAVVPIGAGILTYFLFLAFINQIANCSTH